MSRVLVIDDDEIYGELTMQRLQLDGHEVAFQKGPFGATTAMKKGEFDVVILDLKMPGLSGSSLVDIIKKSDARPRLILCSNIDTAELRDLAGQLGVEGWFPKNVSTEELWKIVKTVCAAPLNT